MEIIDWKELLSLLRGNINAGNIVASLLGKITSFSDTYEILHTLCCTEKDFLTSTEWNTRQNSAFAIQKICEKHKDCFFHEIQTSSQSTYKTEMLQIENLKIQDILNRCYEDLLAGSTILQPYTKDIHSPSWLQTQKIQLLKRLGLDSNNIDVQAAFKYDETSVSVLDSTDVYVETSIPHESSMNSIELTTKEYWFIRLMRMMTVGLLDPVWEVRHGYCLGLSKIINSFKMRQSQDSMKDLPQNLLPLFLLEDILCTSICTLVLDKYFDVDETGSKVISPVKEMASQLIFISSTGLLRLRPFIMDHLLRIHLEMTTCSHWPIRYAALVSMKYFTLMLRSDAQERALCKLLLIVNEINKLLKDESNDIKIACLGVIESTAKVVGYYFNETNLEVMSSAYLTIIRSIYNLALSNAISDDLIFVSVTSSIVAISNELICFVSSIRSRVLTLQISEIFTLSVRILSIMIIKPILSSDSKAEKLLEEFNFHLNIMRYLVTFTSDASIKSELRAADVFSDLFLAYQCYVFMIPHRVGVVNVLDTTDDRVVVIDRLCNITEDLGRELSCIMNNLNTDDKDVDRMILELVEQFFTLSLESTNLQQARDLLGRASMSLKLPWETYRQIKMTEFGKIIVMKYLLAISQSRCSDILNIIEDSLLRAISSTLAKLSELLDSNSISSSTADTSAAAQIKVPRFVVKSNQQISTRSSQRSRRIQLREALQGFILFLMLVNTYQRSNHDTPALVYVPPNNMRDILKGYDDLVCNDDQNADFIQSVIQMILTESNISDFQMKLLTIFEYDQRSDVSVSYVVSICVYLISDRCMSRTKIVNDSQVTLMYGKLLDILIELYFGNSNYSVIITVIKKLMNSMQGNDSKQSVFTFIERIFDDQSVNLNKFEFEILAAPVANQASTALSEYILITMGLLTEHFREEHLMSIFNKQFYLIVYNAFILSMYQLQNIADSIVSANISKTTSLRTCLFKFIESWASRVLDRPLGHEVWSSTLKFFSASLQQKTLSYPRQQLAIVFHNLLISLDIKVIITYYYSWMSIALSGIADYDQLVRKELLKSFRFLVPLATVFHSQRKEHSINVTDIGAYLSHSNIDSISLSTEGRNTFSRSFKFLNDFILLKQTPPSLLESEDDQPLLAELGKHTTLVTNSSRVSSDSSNMTGYQLKAYQWAGISFLTHLRRCGLGALLADEMGLGKTVQALTALATARIEKDMKTYPSLVICPASLIRHWCREITANFSDHLLTPRPIIPSQDGLQSIGIKGYHDIKELYNESNEAVVVIISYDMLSKVYDRNESIIKGQIWEIIIIDEAHLIKNPLSRKTQCILSLRGLFRIALTGTPVQNHVEDLWSIISFLIPDFLGDYKDFHKEYVRPIRKSIQYKKKLLQSPDTKPQSKRVDNNYEITAVGMELLNQLQTQILPFIKRRSKDTVLTELPKKTINNVYCPMTDIQSKMYNSFLKMNQIDGQALEDEIIKYIQLLTVHPSLVVLGKHSKYKSRLANDIQCSGKLMALVDLLISGDVIDEVESIDLMRAVNPVDPIDIDNQADSDDDISSVDIVDQSKMIVNGDSSNRDHMSDEDFEADHQVDFTEGMKKRRRLNQDHLDIDANISSNDARLDLFKDKVIKVSNPPKKNTVMISNENQKSSQYHRKCLVFSQHKATLDIIENSLLKKYLKSVTYERLDSSVSPSDRGRIAEEFNQNSSSTRILLLTTKACGLGLNLTAADIVIFIEHDWNPFADMQAIDRVHRIGQLRPVTVYRLLAESSVEERIIAIQDTKKEIMKQVIPLDSKAYGLDLSSIKGNEDASLGDKIWKSIITNQSAKSNQSSTVIDIQDDDMVSYCEIYDDIDN